MAEFHLYAGRGRKVGSTAMSPTVQGAGPSLNVTLADTHPESVKVTKKANWPELPLMLSAVFGNQRDEGVPHTGGPLSCVFPTIEEFGKFVRPRMRKRRKLTWTPSIGSCGLT